MSQWKFMPMILMTLILPCPVALSETPTTPPAASPSMAEQGQVMVQHGEEMIRQGQIMKENGQKLIQQSGARPTKAGTTAPIIETTTQTTTTVPTTAAPTTQSSNQLLQKVNQYDQYIEQGQKYVQEGQQLQKLIKNPKQIIPGTK